MKKFAILLSSLALAAPAQAKQWSPTTVRTNYVYTFAREACPKHLELAAAPNNQHLEFLSSVAKAARMTPEEANLLVLMCFVYNEGVQKQTS